MVAEAEADGEADGVVADVVVGEGLGDGDDETLEDEEEEFLDNLFDAGEGAVIGPDRLSLRRIGERPKAAAPKTTPSVP